MLHCLTALKKRLLGEEVGSDNVNEWSDEAKEVLERLNDLLKTARYAHSSVQAISPEVVAEELFKFDTELATYILGGPPQNAAAANASGVASATVFAIVSVLVVALSMEVNSAVELFARTVVEYRCEERVCECIRANLATVLSTPVAAQGKGILPTAVITGAIGLWAREQQETVNVLLILVEMGNYILGYEPVVGDAIVDEFFRAPHPVEKELSQTDEPPDDIVDLLVPDDSPEIRVYKTTMLSRSRSATSRPPMCSRTRVEVMNLLSLLELRGLYRVVIQRLMHCFEFFKDKTKLQATVTQALNTADLYIIQCAIQYRSANPVELNKAFDAAFLSGQSAGAAALAGRMAKLNPGIVLPQLIQLNLDQSVFFNCALHRRRLLESNMTLLASLSTSVTLHNLASFGALVSLAPHLFRMAPIDFPAEQQLVGPHVREFDLMVETICSDSKPDVQLFEVGAIVTLCIACLLNKSVLRICRDASPVEDVDMHTNPDKPRKDVRVEAIDGLHIHPAIRAHANTSIFSDEAKICRWFSGKADGMDAVTGNLFLRYVAVGSHAPSRAMHSAVLRMIFTVQQILQVGDAESFAAVSEHLTKGLSLGAMPPRQTNYKDAQILTARAMFLDSWLRRSPEFVMAAMPACAATLAPTAYEALSFNVTGHRQVDDLRSLIYALGHLYVTVFQCLEDHLPEREKFESQFSRQFNSLWVPVEQLANATNRSPTSVALDTLAKGRDWREVLASWTWCFRAVSIGAFADRRPMTIKAALTLLSVDFHGLAERFGEDMRRDWLQGVCSCVVSALSLFNEYTIAPGVDETSILRALGDRLGPVKALLWMINHEIEAANARSCASGEPEMFTLFDNYLNSTAAFKSQTVNKCELASWKTLLMLAIVKSFLSMKGHGANMHAADTIMFLKFIETQLLPDLADAFTTKTAPARPLVTAQAPNAMAASQMIGAPAQEPAAVDNSFQNLVPPIDSNLWRLARLLCEIVACFVGSIPPRLAGGLPPPPRCTKPCPGAAYLATSVCSENSLWQKTLVLCCVKAFDMLESSTSSLPLMLAKSGMKAMYACVTREKAALALGRALHGEDHTKWGSWVNSSGCDLLPYLCTTGSGWGKKLCRYEREFLWSSVPELPAVEPNRPGQAKVPAPAAAVAPAPVPVAMINDVGRTPLVLDLIRWAARNPLSVTTTDYVLPMLCSLIIREPDRLSAVLTSHEADARTLSNLIAYLLSVPEYAYEEVPYRHPAPPSRGKELEFGDSRLLLRSLSSVSGNMDVWLFEQVNLEAVIPDGLGNEAAFYDIVGDARTLTSHLHVCDTFATFPSDSYGLEQMTIKPSGGLAVPIVYLADGKSAVCSHPSQFPVRFVPPRLTTKSKCSLRPLVMPRKRILDMFLVCLHRLVNKKSASVVFPWLPHPSEIVLGLRSMNLCLTKKYLSVPDEAVSSNVLRAISSLVDEEEEEGGDTNENEDSSRLALSHSVKAAEILALCIYHTTLTPAGARGTAQFPLRHIVCRVLRIHSDSVDEEPLLRPYFGLASFRGETRLQMVRWLSAQARLLAAEIDAFFTDDCRTCVECPKTTKCLVIADDDLDLWHRQVGLRKLCRALCAVTGEGGVTILENFAQSLPFVYAAAANVAAETPLADEPSLTDISATETLIPIYERLLGYLILKAICSQIVCTTTCLTKGLVLDKFASTLAPPLNASFAAQLVRHTGYKGTGGAVARKAQDHISGTTVAVHLGVLLFRFTEILHQLVAPDEGTRPSAGVWTTREEAKELLNQLTTCHRLVSSLLESGVSERAPLLSMLERAALLIVEIDKESVMRELNLEDTAFR